MSAVKAHSWIAFAAVVLACGGGAFSSENESGGEGGEGDDGNTGGVLGKAGNGAGGKLGSGGKVGSGGNVGTGGGIGVAGDLVAGGTSPTAGGPGMGGTGPDPDPIDEVCPKDLPDAGNGCAEGLSCSYGVDFRPTCRMRAKCESGKWALFEPSNDCPPLGNCGSAVVVGNTCDLQNADACVKNGSEYCACVQCQGGACADVPPAWQCAGAPNTQGCPNNIPNEGQACAGGAQCPYGHCGLNPNVLLVTCNGATWGWETQDCLPVP